MLTETASSPDSALAELSVAKPSHESILKRLARNSVETTAISVDVSDATPRARSWRSLMGIMSNFSDHLRTLRNLTISRRQLAEVRQETALIRQDTALIHSLVAQNRLLEEKVRELDGTILTLKEKIDTEQASMGQELALLHRTADLQRQSYVEITRRMARSGREEIQPERPRPEHSGEGDPFIDLFYREFEDRFRGSREEILDRLREYLPYVAFLKEEPHRGSVVDIGCGRGEWLEILREEGIDAIGVDLNERQAQAAKDLGLHVVIADALGWMGQQQDRSVSLLSAMHIIEHMTFEQVVDFLKEAARILKPGAALLIETPNPESLIVGGYKFWLDPTHVRPYPPELLSQLLASFSFGQEQVLRLHPDGRNREYRDIYGLAKPITDLLVGPLDYAILCRKP
jgi:SAM-dependent methyltransferase